MWTLSQKTVCWARHPTPQLYWLFLIHFLSQLSKSLKNVPPSLQHWGNRLYLFLFSFCCISKEFKVDKNNQYCWGVGPFQTCCHYDIPKMYIAIIFLVSIMAVKVFLEKSSYLKPVVSSWIMLQPHESPFWHLSSFFNGSAKTFFFSFSSTVPSSDRNSQKN